MKLFISYCGIDAAKVDKIAREIGLIRHEDGSVRFTTWQDKYDLPPASPNWWDAIVDAIISCDIFIFHISVASLQSKVCHAELDFANRLNRPIIPVVLDGEFFFDEQSRRNNVEYWELIPDWLAERQFLFYTEPEFYNQFQEAVAIFESNRPRKIDAPRPLHPDSKRVRETNHALYDTACDYAEHLAFADAEKHFQAFVRRNDADYADWSAQWLELLRRYAELIEIDERPNTRFKFKDKWTIYKALFPKDFLNGIFDPKNFGIRSELTTPAPTTQTAVLTVPAPAVPAQSTSITILPTPFVWIDIPDKGYSIAKYPITNAQFSKFIEADGYKQKKWWTDVGWKAREDGWRYEREWKPSGKAWTEPRYWQDTKWNGREQPVVGVSWYESVAFCLWLSDLTSETIMLPTEYQWQYAAQGVHGKDYPWGKQWEASRCNNNVDKKGIGKTTPVRQYEGKGDSPFGVVDMVGNVWEWCLTDYNNRINDVNNLAYSRVLRGGSWSGYNAGFFRCDYRGRENAYVGNLNIGFRVCRS